MLYDMITNNFPSGINHSFKQHKLNKKKSKSGVKLPLLKQLINTFKIIKISVNKVMNTFLTEIVAVLCLPLLASSDSVNTFL